MHELYKVNYWESFGKPDISITINPNPEIKGNLEMLSSCLEFLRIYDVHSLLDELEKIESGELNEGCCGRELVGAEYNRDITHLEFDFISDEYCELPTPLFKELVEAWGRELTKFNELNGK